jgi:hypothetical protein
MMAGSGNGNGQTVTVMMADDSELGAREGGDIGGMVVV